MSRVLARALRHTGESIPVPWALPIRPTPGDLIIGLAAPGVGKSMIALSWAVRLAQGGRPAAVVTTDTSYGDQAARQVSILRNYSLTTDEVKANRALWAKWLEDQELPLRFSELPVPPDEFQDFMDAEREYLGCYPDLTVVDVAGDMLHGEENVGEIRKIFQELKKAARRSKTVIFALHHIKRGPASSGTKPVTLDDGLYAGEGTAQIVLGMWRLGQNALNVATLKNRNGEASGEGDFFVQLRIDYSRARVTDWNQR